ncbi:MAG: hypothetical protein QME75_16105 [Deltaproteobacteria bacterium]|nr:hypothetical protein [Deltaproteobacteria bacterium]
MDLLVKSYGPDGEKVFSEQSVAASLPLLDAERANAVLRETAELAGNCGGGCARCPVRSLLESLDLRLRFEQRAPA